MNDSPDIEFIKSKSDKISRIMSDLSKSLGAGVTNSRRIMDSVSTAQRLLASIERAIEAAKENDEQQ